MSDLEIKYKKILGELEAMQDRPARPDRFERFNEAVRVYLATTYSHLPPNGKDVFLIAGTNGKGSVAKTLETLLIANGESVGLYTSPHLMDTTERIRSHGRDLTHGEFVEVFECVKPFIDRFELSHFEALTLMMIETFFGGRTRPRVSSAVIEVGVGGRLDPTRAIPHEYAVITKIGLDHEAILGDLASIAREKFAIVEGSRVLVTAPVETAEVSAAMDAAKTNSRLTKFIEADIYPAKVKDGPSWVLESPWGNSPISLVGERGAFNTSIAMQVLRESGRDVQKLLPALSKVAWPGRMEKLRFEKRDVFLSGDHNLQGIASLKEVLTHFHFDKLWLVIGVGKNKSIEQMLGAYFDFGKTWPLKVVLTATNFRAVDINDYGEWNKKAEASYQDAIEALEFAVAKAGPGDLVLVSGSLYLVGDLRAKILERSR